MIVRDVLAPVFNEEGDEAVLAAAQKLDVFEGAHVTVTLATALPDPVIGDGFSAGIVLAEVLDRIHADAEAAKARLLARSWERDTQVRAIEGPSLLLAEAITMAGRHADIAVISTGAGGAPTSLAALESLLMESGRPVLAIPADWRSRTHLRRVFIAWDASRAAARAVGDAAPFIERADEVIVATIDANPSARGVGQLPGADIAAHLARRGAKVEVRNFDGLGEEAEDAVLSASIASVADLIVMGGYGHARLREAIFGGVTRTMLKRSQIPLFLSH